MASCGHGTYRLRREECKSQTGCQIPGEQGPLNELSEAHMNSENETASTGPVPVCTKSSFLYCFYGTPECVDGSLILICLVLFSFC